MTTKISDRNSGCVFGIVNILDLVPLVSRHFRSREHSSANTLYHVTFGARYWYKSGLALSLHVLHWSCITSLSEQDQDKRALTAVKFSRNTSNSAKRCELIALNSSQIFFVSRHFRSKGYLSVKPFVSRHFRSKGSLIQLGINLLISI